MRKHILPAFLLTGILCSCITDNKAETEKKMLVVNADDAAISPEVVEAVLELYAKGVISSTSVIAFGDDFENSIRLLKENDIPTGVHLALNHGSGVLAAEAVPGLHNQDGALWDSVEDTMANLVIEEVRAEWEAQIEKVITAGIQPTHLDSHMGIAFFRADLLKLYMNLGKKYQVALVLPENLPHGDVRRQWEKESIVFSRNLSGVYNLTNESPENRKRAYQKLVDKLVPGINHVYSHPMPDKESVVNSFGDHEIRIGDYNFFSSPEWKLMLQEAGVKLVSYREFAISG